MNQSPHLDQLVCIRTTMLAAGGACIGPIVDGPQALLNKKAFVRAAAPGELVRARIVEDSARFVVAELVEVLESSPQRRPAPCSVFGLCGGCDLQHMSILAQREAKRSMVEQSLRRHLKLAQLVVTDCSQELPEFHYRSRVSLHVSAAGQVGFYRRGSADVIEFSECLLVPPALSGLVDRIRAPLQAHAASIASVVVEQRGQDLELLLVLRDQATPQLSTLAAVFQPLVQSLSISHFSKQLYSSEPSTSATGHFSQVNPAANAVLQREVLARIEGQNVLELYAGAGNFSLPLAAQGKQILAVELDQQLVQLGQRLTANSGMAHKVEFVQSSCEQFVHARSAQRLPDSVLLDPPRSGARQVLDAIMKRSPKETLPKEILYVSCNLATLTRDLQSLLARNYQLLEVVSLDMFPQTHHVEVIARLERC